MNVDQEAIRYKDGRTAEGQPQSRLFMAAARGRYS